MSNVEKRLSKESAVTYTIAAELLSYDEANGLIYWKTSGSGRLLDRPAGSLETNGYYSVCINGIRLKLHRVIWLLHYGRWPEKFIDHIDGDKTNNRISNLREATTRQNGWNRKSSKANTSGHRGVRQRYGKWHAVITYNGEEIRIGSFQTFEDAVTARIQKEIELYGDYRPQ